MEHWPDVYEDFIVSKSKLLGVRAVFEYSSLVFDALCKYTTAKKERRRLQTIGAIFQVNICHTFAC